MMRTMFGTSLRASGAASGCHCPVCVSTTRAMEMEWEQPAPNLAQFQKAAAYNRASAQRLGWATYRDRIATRLLGLTASADDLSFAASVARWQSGQGLQADGLIGPSTWAAMKRLLGLTSGPAPSNAALPPKEASPPLQTIYTAINLGIPATLPITGIYVPPAFVREAPIEIIVWLRGFSQAGSIDRYWKQAMFPMREAVLQSGRNCILVAPTLGPRSQASNLVSQGGFDSFIGQVMQRLVSEGFLRSNASIRSIVLACHSGGGGPMLNIATLGDKASQLITACWGFDCTYNSDNASRWSKWAASRWQTQLFFYYRPGSGTANQAERLACLTQGQGNVFVQPSKLGHNELVLPAWRERLAGQPAPPFTKKCPKPSSRELLGKAFEYEISNLEQAVAYNRDKANSIGWGKHLQDIAQRVLRLPGIPSEQVFAQKIADWQAAQGLTADGKLGQKTWDKMRPLLGLTSTPSAPTAPSGTVPGLSSSCPDSPGKWAKDYFRGKLWPWWNDQQLSKARPPESVPVGTSIRQMMPQVFPGVPPEVMLGFCANGSLRENTTEGVATQPFHEIGLFGTEAGPRNGPAPNPNPKASSNSWGVLHNHPLVVKLLGGRPATMTHNAWKNAVPDQVAVGLVNIRRHGENVAKRLAPAIRPNTTSPNLSLFFVACGFMGWSAGDSRAARHLNRFASEMSRYPENLRWGAFLKILAEQISSGQLSLSGLYKHASPAHSALRTWQKIAGGQLLAATTKGNQRWFDTGLGADEERVADIITCAAAKAKHR